MISEVRIEIPRNRPVMAGNSNLIDEILIDFIFTFLKKHSVKRKKKLYSGKVLLRLPKWLTDKNPPAEQRRGFKSLGREDPLKKEMETHSSIFA